MLTVDEPRQKLCFYRLKKPEAELRQSIFLNDFVLGFHAQKDEFDVKKLYVLRHQGVTVLAEDEFDDDWHVDRHISFEPGYFGDAVYTLLASHSQMLVLFQECLEMVDLQSSKMQRLMNFKQDEVGAVALVEKRIWISQNARSQLLIC